MIWFDDDCERRRLIYIDEMQPGTSLSKWRRRTFINALSSVKQSSVGCKEIYKSPFLEKNIDIVSEWCYSTFADTLSE